VFTCGNMKLLLVAATENEIAPLLSFLQGVGKPLPGKAFSLGNTEVHICISGVGMMSTTYELIKKMNSQSFGFALQAGVAGSFREDIPLGSLVTVQSEQYGDLGAEDHYNFLDVFDLGLLEKDAAPFTGGALYAPVHTYESIMPAVQVRGLTVNTGSGSAFTIKARREKYNCEVESMEGLAFYYVCLKENLPFAQVRSISNYVIPRDRESWRMKEAIVNLNGWLVEFIRDIQVSNGNF
jgi:futalosine hydrolase